MVALIGTAGTTAFLYQAVCQREDAVAVRLQRLARCGDRLLVGANRVEDIGRSFAFLREQQCCLPDVAPVVEPVARLGNDLQHFIEPLALIVELTAQGGELIDHVVQGSDAGNGS